MDTSRAGTPESQAMDRALRYLASGPRTQAQVHRRLAERFPAETVEAVLERLRRDGLLDDRAYAFSWVHSRLAHRPRSSRLMARELEERGVARATIEEALADANEEEAAYQAGLKLLRHADSSDYWQFRRKGWQFLQRRGFTSATIHHALRRLWEEAGGAAPLEDVPGFAP